MLSLGFRPPSDAEGTLSVFNFLQQSVLENGLHTGLEKRIQTTFD